MTYEELQKKYIDGDYCMCMDFEEFCSRFGRGEHMMPETIERNCVNAICTYDELAMKYAAKCKELDELKKSRTEIHTCLYDKEEIYHDCTVQVLTNTVTGENSIGWWRNDNPPAGASEEVIE